MAAVDVERLAEIATLLEDVARSLRRGHVAEIGGDLERLAELMEAWRGGLWPIGD